SRSHEIKDKIKGKGKGEISRLPPLLRFAAVGACAFAFDLRGPSGAAEAADKTRRAPHMDGRRFPRGLRCPLGKSRRPRGPGAQHRAGRGGVLSLLQVSLHRQRKGARAVTARKPLILPLLLLATHKSKSSSLRSPPHPPSGHLLPQAGEGL